MISTTVSVYKHHIADAKGLPRPLATSQKSLSSASAIELLHGTCLTVQRFLLDLCQNLKKTIMAFISNKLFVKYRRYKACYKKESIRLWLWKICLKARHLQRQEKRSLWIVGEYFLCGVADQWMKWCKSHADELAARYKWTRCTGNEYIYYLYSVVLVLARYCCYFAANFGRRMKK